MTRALYFERKAAGRQSHALELYDRDTAFRNQRPELFDRPTHRVRIVDQEAYNRFMAKINEFSDKTAEIRKVHTRV
jgi:hypothetical protein